MKKVSNAPKSYPSGKHVIVKLKNNVAIQMRLSLSSIKCGDMMNRSVLGGQVYPYKNSQARTF